MNNSQIDLIFSHKLEFKSRIITMSINKISKAKKKIDKTEQKSKLSGKKRRKYKDAKEVLEDKTKRKRAKNKE